MNGELRSTTFRREREGSWRELERLVERFEKGRASALSAAELARLPVLYRAALSSLSVARAISLDRALVLYLEALAFRAYNAIYGVRRRLPEALAHFLFRKFPRTVRARWLAVLVAALALLAGTLVGWATTSHEADTFYAYVPGAFADGRGPTATTEDLRSFLYRDEPFGERLLAFASALFTNNAQVGFLAFALGFLAGFPTFLLLFGNGLTLGAFGALYHQRGLSAEFWAWVLPHGVPELTAIVLCGAAGFLIGHGLLFPGPYGRLEGLARRGREAGCLVVGAVLLLLVAGLVEGIFRQTVHAVPVRYAVALVGAAGLALWIARAGRREPS